MRTSRWLDASVQRFGDMPIWALPLFLLAVGIPIGALFGLLQALGLIAGRTLAIAEFAILSPALEEFFRWAAARGASRIGQADEINRRLVIYTAIVIVGEGVPVILTHAIGPHTDPVGGFLSALRVRAPASALHALLSIGIARFVGRSAEPVRSKELWLPTLAFALHSVFDVVV